MRQHVAMPPLTRTEAENRARLLDVHHYTVDLDLTRPDELFGSTTTIRFTARDPGATTFVELKPAALHRAVLNGRPLDPGQLRDNRLELTGLAADNELTVEADMRYSSTGEGLHLFCDPADGERYLYSQCCLDDAQRVFACFDQPDLKATFDISVTAPPGWTVVSNGVTTEDPARPGRWHATTTPPLSTYLAAVVAGPYHTVRAEHRGLPLALHCRRSLAPHLDRDADELFTLTRDCLDHYAGLFDEPYPFDSYEQAFVPEFNAGAMENPGLVTIRDEYLFRSAVTDTERQWRAAVIAHEMAHMWFGDLVTMAWWDDLWLNESFAEYMGWQTAAVATRFTGAWAAFAGTRKNWGYAADQRPTTHPVAPPADAVPDTASALSNFDGISYAKGASALRQLVAWLGEKTFLAGVNDHITRHRFGNATLADFLDSLTRAADGRDVHAWAERWLRTPGVDTLEVDDTGDGALRVTRRTGSRPHHLAIGLYDTTESPGRLRLSHTLLAELPADQDHTVLPLPGDQTRPRIVIPNDGDLSYCKVRTDPGTWTTATTALSAVPGALSRAVLWTAARDRLRDAELTPAEYLRTVTTHLPAETDTALIEDVLNHTRGTVVDCYLPPGQRAAALDDLTAVCRALLRHPASATDGDARLAALRTLIDSAHTTEAARELEHWLAHGTIPGGPDLDPELRWRITLRLCVIGAASETEIGAELEHDPTSTGREAAARCRAALPTAAAKRLAWHALFEDDTLSTHQVTATAQGFWQPEHHPVLDEYTTAWFDAAARTAQRRGPAVATALTVHGFPRHAAEPAVAAAGEACLARDDLPPVFRRRLTDQLDDLKRAIRVRATAG